MVDTSSIQIYVGSAHGQPTAIQVSRRARELCPLLRNLAPGSLLPTTFITPFRIVLSYLDGDTSLINFTRFNRDTSILLLFATTWSLAARLHLPDLQNALVSAMADIYAECIQLRHEYPADAHVDHAFRHLRADVGSGSHAEALLICFIGRTAPMIPALIKQMKLYHFDKDISERILFEARSFAPDPLQYNIARFQVDMTCPMPYIPIEIEHASPLDDHFGTLSMLEKCRVQSPESFTAAKERINVHHTSYMPPSAESVASHGTINELKFTPAKKPDFWLEPIPIHPINKTMDFIGGLSPLEKLKYMDTFPAVPAPALTVGAVIVPSPILPESLPLPHVPNAAATAAANAALHPPPQPRRATPIAPTRPRVVLGSLPEEFRCSVRIETDEVNEERIEVRDVVETPSAPHTAASIQPDVPAQPEVAAQPERRARPAEPTQSEIPRAVSGVASTQQGASAQSSVQAQSEVQTRPEFQAQPETRQVEDTPPAVPTATPSQPAAQAQPEVHAEADVQRNADDGGSASPRRLSTRPRPEPAHVETSFKRKSWLRHLFTRRPGSSAPGTSTRPPGRTNPRRPPPPISSEGGTWAYGRTNSHRGCHTPARPSNTNDDSRVPSSRPQRQLALPSYPGEGDDEGRRDRGRSPPRPRSGDGSGGGRRSRRSLSACWGDEREAWAGSRKKGSRTGFALMSFNRRRYDE